MLKSGQIIADYQVVKPLFENQLFATYQVSSENRPAAKLLVFPADLFADKKASESFLSQSRLLTGQSFPGLECLIDAGFEDEYGYCVFPMPAGDPLADKLVQEWTVREILELVRAVASNLALAHESGIWHGAISPASIYQIDSSVSLDQFALTSLLQLDFHSGLDPRYTSPELVRGEVPDPATDVYSLGVVLYRLLVGKVPFSGSDAFSTAMLHVQEQVDPLPSELNLLQPLLDNLLTAIPAERITAGQLVIDIDRLLESPQANELKTILNDPGSQETTGKQDETPSRVEKLIEQSDMTARIEERLKERSEVLQQTAEFTPDAKRASTNRITAIGQQSYRENKDMNNNPYQQQRRSSRFLVLLALGIAVGMIIYAALFVKPSNTFDSTAALPDALQAGLQKGSFELGAGEIQKAEKTFLELVDEFAGYPQPYNNLAAIAAQNGDLESSRELLERAMATDSAYATIYRNLGTVYAEMARDSYGRALQLEQGQQAIALQLFGSDELIAAAATNSKEPQQEVSVAQESDSEEQTEDAQVVAVNVAAEVDKDNTETVSTEKVAEVVIPLEEVVEATQPETAEDFLNRWAKAWSNQNVDAYLGFYGADFKPSSGDSREQWAKLRKSRLTRPKSIDILLSEFSTIGESEGKIRIEVTQAYKSDRYSDKTRKRFDLTLENNEWQIARERSLGRAR